MVAHTHTQIHTHTHTNTHTHTHTYTHTTGLVLMKAVWVCIGADAVRQMSSKLYRIKCSILLRSLKPVTPVMVISRSVRHFKIAILCFYVFCASMYYGICAVINIFSKWYCIFYLDFFSFLDAPSARNISFFFKMITFDKCTINIKPAILLLYADNMWCHYVKLGYMKLSA